MESHALPVDMIVSPDGMLTHYCGGITPDKTWYISGLVGSIPSVIHSDEIQLKRCSVYRVISERRPTEDDVRHLQKLVPSLRVIVWMREIEGHQDVIFHKRG
jgi:hypothetical protein